MAFRKRNNSRTYADMYLKEQAAGFAYAWKS